MLRSRKLPPGLGTPAEQVAESQRRRLLAGMVIAVDDAGYEAATVADVIELAGVSRGTFYEHFEDREACFLAAFDVISEGTLRAVREQLEPHDSWEVRLHGALEGLVSMIVAEPAAARLCMVDVYVLGPAGMDRAQRALDGWAKLLRELFADAPERAGLPPLVLRGIAAGLAGVIAARLRRREEHDLTGMVGELWAWLMAHPTLPVAIGTGRRRLVEPAPPRTLPPGDEERLLAAFTATVAEHGYHEASTKTVVARAQASLSTFYGRFDGKPGAIDAALDVAFAQVAAVAGPAFRRQADHSHALHAGLRAGLWRLATEPDLARLVFAESLAAGPAAQAQLDRGLAAVRHAMAAPAASEPRAAPVLREAAAWALLLLGHETVRDRGPDHLLRILPAVTYLALSPFTGAQAAATIAKEPWSS